MHVWGGETCPRRGVLIVASNDKELWDPFFIGVCMCCYLRLHGEDRADRRRADRRLLARAAAFPRRPDAAPTRMHSKTRGHRAAAGRPAGVLPRGHAGPRPDQTGNPKRGAVRRAPRAGARRSAPAAIMGSEAASIGLFSKPCRVQVAFASRLWRSASLPSNPERAARGSGGHGLAGGRGLKFNCLRAYSTLFVGWLQCTRDRLRRARPAARGPFVSQEEVEAPLEALKAL